MNNFFCIILLSTIIMLFYFDEKRNIRRKKGGNIKYRNIRIIIFIVCSLLMLLWFLYSKQGYNENRIVPEERNVPEEGGIFFPNGIAGIAPPGKYNIWGERVDNEE